MFRNHEFVYKIVDSLIKQAIEIIMISESTTKTDSTKWFVTQKAVQKLQVWRTQKQTKPIKDNFQNQLHKLTKIGSANFCLFILWV